MSTVEIVIAPRTRDLGGFTVGRVLPVANAPTMRGAGSDKKLHGVQSWVDAFIQTTFYTGA